MIHKNQKLITEIHMRTLKEIKALYAPKAQKEDDKIETAGLQIKSADEKRFADKHVIKKIADRNGNGDDVFNATNVKGVERSPKHGYNPGEDEKVYEEVEKEEIDLKEYEQHIYYDSSGRKRIRDDDGNNEPYYGRRSRGTYFGTRSGNREPDADDSSGTPHAVHINGRKWKEFGTKRHAENVAKKLGDKATVHPVKEEVESIDEKAKWRSTPVAQKVTDPEDWASSHSYDYHHDNPRSTGMLKATSDTPEKYSSLSARRRSQVATQGPRKGMITKRSAESLKNKIKANLRGEEVELDERCWDEYKPVKGKDAYSKGSCKKEETELAEASSTSATSMHAATRKRDPQRQDPEHNFRVGDDVVAKKGDKPGKVVFVDGEKIHVKGTNPYYPDRVTHHTASELKKEETELEEGDVIHFPGKMKAEKEKPDTAPGWMLRKSPELAQKIKDAQDRVKKRKEIKEASKAPMDPEKKAKKAIDDILKMHEDPPSEKGMKIGEAKDTESVPFKGPYDKPPVKQPGQKSDPGLSTARHLAKQAMQKMIDKTKKEEVEYVNEVLKPSMGAGAYISDFVHSKNPKFAGKSKKERMQQALAAYYAAKRGEK